MRCVVWAAMVMQCGDAAARHFCSSPAHVQRMAKRIGQLARLEVRKARRIRGMVAETRRCDVSATGA